MYRRLLSVWVSSSKRSFLINTAILILFTVHISQTKPLTLTIAVVLLPNGTVLFYNKTDDNFEYLNRPDPNLKVGRLPWPRNPTKPSVHEENHFQ